MRARPPQDPRPSRGHDHRASRSPFSRPLNVHSVKDNALLVAIEAAPEELIVIAEATKLPAVQSLDVRFRIKSRTGGRYDVSGDLRATISQVCVVTLESFESEVSNEIDLVFAQPLHVADMPGLDRRFKDAEPSSRNALRDAERFPRGPAPVPGNDDQEDPADVIVDDTIDLGAIALEFLTLACDLYPRKPGVQFSDTSIGENAEPDPSAFAALGRLKDQT